MCLYDVFLSDLGAIVDREILLLREQLFFSTDTMELRDRQFEPLTVLKMFGD